MKTILLPTDFSKNSINAINYAVKLFAYTSCNFYILNVQKASSFISDDLMTVSSSATIYATLVDAAKASIKNIISQIEKNNKNKKHRFHSIVDYDNFIDSINQVCDNHGVDLIIMGTQGASGLDKVLFGSNTVRVMQRCKAPVLAIPHGCEFKSMDNLAFAITTSKKFELEEIEILREIMIMNKSSLQIYHLGDQNHFVYDTDENIDFFNQNFNQLKHEFVDTTKEDMFNVVSDYIKKNNIDMLAIMNKKHSFLERLFATHSVERFAFKMEIPLLVMQHK